MIGAIILMLVGLLLLLLIFVGLWDLSERMRKLLVSVGNMNLSLQSIMCETNALLNKSIETGTTDIGDMIQVMAVMTDAMETYAEELKRANKKAKKK